MGVEGCGALRGRQVREAAEVVVAVALDMRQTERGDHAQVLLQRDGMPLLLEQTEGDISKRPASNVDPYGLDALYVVRDVAALFEELHGKPIPEGAKDFMVKTPEGYILVFTGSL